MLLGLNRHTTRAFKTISCTIRLLSSMSESAPAARAFRLALIQMGGVTADKSHNLAHARDLILKASNPQDGQKPGVVVLPVSCDLVYMQKCLKILS